jgi:hypothetical protein
LIGRHVPAHATRCGPLEAGAPSNTSEQSIELGAINILRGDIVKVWFVKDGTFYIASAMPCNETQLMQILKSWQFHQNTAVTAYWNNRPTSSPR